MSHVKRIEYFWAQAGRFPINIFFVNVNLFRMIFNHKKAVCLCRQLQNDPYGIRTRVTAVKGRCLNRLTKGPDMVGLNGLEPSTSRLSGVRSNQLSYRPILIGAGDGNRTHDISLEG